MNRMILLLMLFSSILATNCSASQPKPSKLVGSFPIAVWLQEPSLAPQYLKAGFNLYVGLWQGPTEQQLDQLKAANMPVICEQNAVALKHLNDPMIYGWMQQDEPDNAQPLPQGGYGPCVPPEKVVQIYQKIHAEDPSRPSMLNLGQGVANDQWLGRGSGAKLSDYLTYVNGGDIISFDIYPIAQFGPKAGADQLWLVAKGVDRLVQWTEGKKPIWCCIECTNIDGNGQATPEQVRSEVWMAIIHGVRGLIYFVHQFKPQFDAHALLDDPVMLQAVTKINRQVQQMNPILTSRPLKNIVSVTSSASNVPISIISRKYKEAIYIFAVGMRNGTTKATFNVTGLPQNSHVTASGENRSIDIRNGEFQDDFTPYQVHIYRISP